ncbi:endo-1,4-beta-xylanase [Alternaria panax]|uniref:Beta-xylanase n=1 Tax=Alternaria panax TaxID=48097 RepID=A0AAD4F9Q3_9PLEO|nr:endo-1,4-beta-xylanase [Alternaria panax]
MKTTALFLAPILAAASPLDQRAAPRPEGSIDAAFKAVGKIYFGTATEYARLSEGENQAIIKADFGQVTPEYTMKWKETQPQRNVFTLDPADNLVKWAVANQKSIRGHTLLWWDSIPDYVKAIKDKQGMRDAITDHVTKLVGRDGWKGKIRAWDVVNEAIDGNHMRSNAFYDVLGDEYIKVAFEAARAADPAAKLYINDYNLEDATYAEHKFMVAKVNEWNGKWQAGGRPLIDGIGSQTHLDAGHATAVEGALRSLAAANVAEVAITELDIQGANPQEYQDVVQYCYWVPHCVGVTTWGVRDNEAAGKNTPDETPLLFGSDWAAKNAYFAIRDYLLNLKKN